MAPSAPDAANDDEIIELTDVIEEGSKKPAKKEVAASDVSVGDDDVDLSFEDELEDLFADADELAPKKKGPSKKDTDDMDDMLGADDSAAEDDDMDIDFDSLGDEKAAAEGSDESLDDLDFSDLDDDFSDFEDDSGTNLDEEASPEVKKKAVAKEAASGDEETAAASTEGGGDDDGDDDELGDLGDLGDLGEFEDLFDGLDDDEEAEAPAPAPKPAAPKPAAKKPAPAAEKAAEPAGQDDIDALLGEMGDLDFDDVPDDVPGEAAGETPAEPGGDEEAEAPAPAPKPAAPKPAAKKPAPAAEKAAEPAGQDDIDALLGEMGDLDFDDVPDDVPGEAAGETPAEAGGDEEAEAPAPAPKPAAPKPAAKKPAPAAEKAAEPAGQDDIDALLGEMDFGEQDESKGSAPADKDNPAESNLAEESEDFDMGFDDLDAIGEDDDDSDGAPPAEAQQDVEAPSQQMSGQDEIDDLLGDLEAGDFAGLGTDAEQDFGADLINEIDGEDEEATGEVASAEEEGREIDFEVLSTQEDSEEPEESEAKGGNLGDFDLDALGEELSIDLDAEPDGEAPGGDASETVAGGGTDEDIAAGDIDIEDFDLDEPTEVVAAPAEGEAVAAEEDVFAFDEEEKSLAPDSGGIDADATQEISLSDEETTESRGADEDIDLDGLDELIDGLDFPEDEKPGEAMDEGPVAEESFEALDEEHEGEEVVEEQEASMELAAEDLDDIDALLAEEGGDKRKPDEDAELEIGEQDLDAIESALNEEELPEEEDEEARDFADDLEAELEETENGPEVAAGAEVDVEAASGDFTLSDFDLAEENPLPEGVLDEELGEMGEEEFEKAIERAEQQEHSQEVPAAGGELLALKETVARLESELQDLRSGQVFENKLTAAGEALQKSLEQRLDRSVQRALEEHTHSMQDKIRQSVQEQLDNTIPAESSAIADDVYARLEDSMERKRQEEAPGLAEMQSRFAEGLGPDSPVVQKLRELLAPEIESIVNEGLLPLRGEGTGGAGMEERFAELQASLEERIAKSIPETAARIIREEIAALLEELS